MRTHGLRGTYVDGCRCDECRTADRNYKRSRRDPAPPTDDPWVPDGPPTPGRWVERAACRGLDTELFFPGRGQSIDELRAICQPCPVRTDCLAWSLTDPN